MTDVAKSNKILGLFAIVVTDENGDEMIAASSPSPGVPPQVMITDKVERAEEWAASCQDFANKTKKSVSICGFVRMEESLMSKEPQTIITEEPKLIIP
jgi:hypothetical protein